jgi:site-specific DNA-methyltransferase (adenine-specific)
MTDDKDPEVLDGQISIYDELEGEVSLYYEDESVKLYHGDCSKIHDWMHASVLVSDVPYGIKYESNRPRETMARSIAGDEDTSMRDYAITAFQRHHYDGLDAPMLIFGTWRRPRPAGTRQVLIWDTKGALGMGATDLPWKPAHQEIYVLGKGFTGHRGSDVLTHAPVQSLGRNGRVHPHQKPVELMQDLIAKCPPGTIADPFAGSGSTLVAAKALGRQGDRCRARREVLRGRRQASVSGSPRPRRHRMTDDEEPEVLEGQTTIYDQLEESP